jgi:hypothetical protein
MTDDSFRKFRCWKTADVQQTIFGDIGWLRAQDDAIFLAAHAPIVVERQKGEGGHGPGEVQILNALRNEIGITGRNTLIAITGAVGTGKSHAVRWVHSHLEDDPLRYRTIYVPRDLSTLRVLLSRILAGLPGDKARQAERQLDVAIGGKSDSQLRDDLILNLRQVLAYELPDQRSSNDDSDDREERSFLLGKREDRDTGRRDGLATILLNPRVMEHLSRDGGTVAAIIMSIQSNRGGRDEIYPQFTTEDIPRYLTGIVNQLDPDARPVWESVRTEPGGAVALLNEALQRAVPMTLGFGIGLTLNEVFLDTRRILRQEGIELVLLFEDLALFGLVDDDLYDQFSQQPHDEYCPLRVIFAATTAKYNEIRDTVRDRLTYHYVIQNLENEDGNADPAMVRFVARYLNNARIGRNSLIAARSNADAHARENNTWVPNACETRENGKMCRYRDDCFDAFGSVDTGVGSQVGLYPHNVVSLRRAFRHLSDKNQLSPRHLVDDVVRSFLNTAEPEIAVGIFPSEEVGRWFFMGVDRPQQAIVGEDELSNPEERERLLRARIAWANGEPENPGIHLAFDLPGIAKSSRATLAQNTTPPIAVSVRALAHTPESQLPSGPPTNRAQSLYDWESKVTPLPHNEMEAFRRAFRDWTVARVDLGRHLIYTGKGITEVILNRIFPATSFVIDYAPGAKPAAGNLQFAIYPTPEGLRLLMAARWFGDHGHWDTVNDCKWEFPPDLQSDKLQIELENFLSKCATAVNERFFQEITSAGGVRPAPAAVILRGAALRVLGHLSRDDKAQIVSAIAKSTPSLPDSWLPSWAEIARPATKVVNTLDEALIADFAAAHQGESRDPIVIDAAALEQAGRDAIDDPAAVVARLGEFPEFFSELELARASLTVDWATTVATERQELLARLQFLQAVTGSTARDIATWADELGTRANNDRVFRPAGAYPRFRREIETLKSHSRDVVNEWTGSAAAIRDPDNPAAVFDAQSWAAQARSYTSALEFVLDAMEATVQLLEERTAQRAGGNPDELAQRVATQLSDTAGQLERLGRGGTHE